MRTLKMTVNQKLNAIQTTALMGSLMGTSHENRI